MGSSFARRGAHRLARALPGLGQQLQPPSQRWAGASAADATSRHCRRGGAGKRSAHLLRRPRRLQHAGRAGALRQRQLPAEREQHELTEHGDVLPGRAQQPVRRLAERVQHEHQRCGRQRGHQPDASAAAASRASSPSRRPARTAARRISDSQIQNELAAQIIAGHLPAPTTDAAGNNNTYYAIFFPHGNTITLGGSTLVRQRRLLRLSRHDRQRRRARDLLRRAPRHAGRLGLRHRLRRRRLPSRTRPRSPHTR